MKILIIDDDEDIRKLVSYHLSLSQHEVLAAANGKEGLEIAINEKLDLILLDIMMPEMDGFEVCIRLKKDRKTKSIPVFMLTSKTRIGDVESAFKVGADNYITKPFNAKDLDNIIKRKYRKLKKLK